MPAYVIKGAGANQVQLGAQKGGMYASCAQRVASNGAEVSSTWLVAKKSTQRLSFDGWASDMAAMVAVAF